MEMLNQLPSKSKFRKNYRFLTEILCKLAGKEMETNDTNVCEKNYKVAGISHIYEEEYRILLKEITGKSLFLKWDVMRVRSDLVTVDNRLVCGLLDELNDILREADENYMFVSQDNFDAGILILVILKMLKDSNLPESLLSENVRNMIGRLPTAIEEFNNKLEELGCEERLTL